MGWLTVLCLLFRVTAFLPCVPCISGITAATTAWVIAAAEPAFAAATVAAFSLLASGWAGCDVRRGEQRTNVG